MNSLDDIWQIVIDRLREKLTDTSIQTWFADCRPIDMGDRSMVLQTTSSFKRDTIVRRFEGDIRAVLSDLFSSDIDVVVLTEEEVEEYTSRKPSTASLPEALEYTFDRFIVGQSNKYAHAAAVAVSENPGMAYNPLFIYGNSGLGKTHLLLAIGHVIQDRDPNVKIGYVKGDDFTNQMVRSLREHTEEEFRQRYRYVDLFLVDDIQFVSGKQGVQLEFFHTFETLYQAGHQIVITCDRPPMELAQLEDRLRSRFEGGLMADIQPPDVELRMAITRNKAQGLGLVLPDDVVQYIADNITANIRQIEGVVKRLSAYRGLEGGTINVQSVKRAIEDVIRTGVYIPTPDVIIGETGRYFDIEPEDILSQNRSKNTAYARQIAMYLMRKLTNMSLKDVGRQFSRNHSTALNAINKIEERLETDPNTARTIRDISSNINSLHDR